MSTSKAQDLTPDEQILHHHAAMVKRDLEAYHIYIRSKEDWRDLFIDHLACVILIIHFHKPFSDSSRRNQ